jgi:hypothetical protein
MNLHSFLMRVGFTEEKPDHVSPNRWRAMLVWYYARVALGSVQASYALAF